MLHMHESSLGAGGSSRLTWMVQLEASSMTTPFKLQQHHEQAVVQQGWDGGDGVMAHVSLEESPLLLVAYSISLPKLNLMDRYFCLVGSCASRLSYLEIRRDCNGGL
ncbi:hypothetical protein H0G86_003497 [Trichoderma simmonsii]|uniref:Uncharacterized protein n=1 Tax=Trichoderma simmonsii TaxID=1491479 RepID=A0A8G0L7S9_9HYPO|nr:hypothetical protein H0G86_003497 [Trichoderma simmonsii]